MLGMNDIESHQTIPSVSHTKSTPEEKCPVARHNTLSDEYDNETKKNHREVSIKSEQE